MAAETKLLSRAMWKLRKRPLDDAQIAWALAALARNDDATKHARRSSVKILRALLKSGGEPKMRMVEPFYDALVLLGQTWDVLGDAGLSERHALAAVACACAGSRQFGRHDLVSDAISRTGGLLCAPGSSESLRRVAATVRLIGDGAQRLALETQLAAAIQKTTREGDRERSLALVQEVMNAATPPPADAGRVRRLWDCIRSRAERKAWDQEIPGLVGDAKREWVRMHARSAITRAAILVPFSIILFIACLVVCHLRTEQAIDALLERATMGFLPVAGGQPFVPTEDRVLLISHLGFFGLMILVIVRGFWRSLRISLVTRRFGDEYRGLKVAAWAVTASLAVLLGLACIGLHRAGNLFRTPMSFIPALGATVPDDPAMRRETLSRLSDAMEFPVSNLSDNYLRVLLGLHYEAAGDYAAAIYAWARTSRQAYFPMPTPRFMEYEVQIRRRLSMVAGYERRIRENPDSPELLGELGSYLLCHGRVVGATQRLTRAFELDPAGAGLFRHDLSVSQAVRLLEKNSRFIVSSDDRGVDRAAGFLEAVAETTLLHRLGWAVRTALDRSPGWAAASLQAQANRSIQAVRDVCAKRPKDPIACLNLAEFLTLARQMKEADRLFADADALGGMDAHAYATWGTVLHGLRNYAKACSAFESAERLSPKAVQVADVLIRWGWSLAQVGKRSDAESRFLAAIACEPDDAKCHWEYGRVLNFWEEYEKAVVEFRRATEGMWPCQQTYADWACALNRLGRSEQAIEITRRAILFRPSSPSTYTGPVMETLRGVPDAKYESARERLIGKVSELRKDTLAPWEPDIHMARALAAVGDFPSARQVLFRLEFFVPWKDRFGWMTRSAAEYCLYATAYLDTGDARAAMAKFQMAIRADEGDPDAWAGLGQTCARRGKRRQFGKAFQKAAGQILSADLCIRWAQSHEEMGGFSSAADLYGRAVEAGDGSYRPMLGRAQALVKAGRAEDAWKELQARVEKTPGSASSWQAMALFLMHSQRWSEASPCLASALAKYPRSRSLRQLAGVCALGQRDYTAAVQHFTAVRNEGEKDPMLPVYRYVALAHTAGVEQARETVPEVKDAAQIRHNLWPTPLLRSCAGGLDAAVLLRSAARRVGPEQSASQVTQAHYLLGEMALLAGDKDGALRHWSECVKSGDGRSLPGLLANQLIHLLVP